MTCTKMKINGGAYEFYTSISMHIRYNLVNTKEKANINFESNTKSNPITLPWFKFFSIQNYTIEVIC